MFIDIAFKEKIILDKSIIYKMFLEKKLRDKTFRDTTIRDSRNIFAGDGSQAEGRSPSGGPACRKVGHRLTKTTLFYVVHKVAAMGPRAAQKCSRIIQDTIQISF